MIGQDHPHDPAATRKQAIERHLLEGASQNERNLHTAAVSADVADDAYLMPHERGPEKVDKPATDVELTLIRLEARIENLAQKVLMLPAFSCRIEQATARVRGGASEGSLGVSSRPSFDDTPDCLLGALQRLEAMIETSAEEAERGLLRLAEACDELDAAV